MALVRSMALVASALCCLRFAAALEQETKLLRASDAVGSRKLLFDMSQLESMGWDCNKVDNGGQYSWRWYAPCMYETASVPRPYAMAQVACATHVDTLPLHACCSHPNS